MVNTTFNAYKNWCECFGLATRYDISQIFNSAMYGMYAGDNGDYMFMYKNKHVTAHLVDNNIVYFNIKANFEMTTHAYTRWRERINKTPTNKEIDKILLSVDMSSWKDGDITFVHDEKNIDLVIKDNKILTVILIK